MPVVSCGVEENTPSASVRVPLQSARLLPAPCSGRCAGLEARRVRREIEQSDFEPPAGRPACTICHTSRREQQPILRSERRDVVVAEEGMKTRFTELANVEGCRSVDEGP